MGSTGSLKRLFRERAFAIATTVTLLVGGMAGFSGSSLASHPEVSLANSNFEIDTDANLKVDDASPPSLDWANVVEMRKDDKPSGSSDDSFKSSKESESDPQIEDGSIPPSKSDLKSFGIYQEANAKGRFLNMFWSRVQDPSGTTNMDFEFNKKACTVANPTDCSANGVTPDRSVDDMLVTYDLDRGGDDPTISIRMWDGTNWGPETNLTAAGLAVGSINSTAIPGGADGAGVGPLDPFTFGEAQVDLSIIFDATKCESFGSAYLKSRSSTPITAELKDFIAPLTAKISNCGSVKIKKVDDKGNPLAGAEFTLYKDNAPIGGTKGNEDIATNPAKKCTTAANGECTINEVLAGEYWVVETITPPGYDTAPPQHVTVVADQEAGPLVFENPRHTGKIKVVKLLKDHLGDPVVPDDASDLDGAAFLAFVDGNANGTYQAGEEAKRWDNGLPATCTVSGGAGFCEIGPLATGIYGIHETAAPAGSTPGSDQFPVVVVKSATVTVNYTNSLAPLNITLDKSGEDLAHVGDTVKYVFKATTLGPKLHDLNLEELVPDRCDGAISGPVKTGDQDDFLEPGEVWTYGCDHVVTDGDPDPLHNEAKITGTDDFGRTVSDTDTHTVLILKPVITLDKKVENGDHKPVGSAYQAHVGETLHYTVVITNTGDADLEISALSDTLKASLPASCSQGIGSTLAPNASISCAYTMVASADAHNVASVTGVDDLGGAKGTVSASDETFVDVIHPAVKVVKDGPGIVHAGDTADFTFKVTNTGDVPLNDIVVVDSEFGPIGTIAGPLAPGASQTITENFKVPGQVAGPNCPEGHYNVATVTAEDPTNTAVTPDTDDHCTELADPKIEVVKDGPGQKHAGDTATFTFKVTNIGNVPLVNIAVTDSAFGAIGTIAGPLAAGASQTITADFVIPGKLAGANCPEGHYNVATASGQDQLVPPKTVSDTDDHCTALGDPKIEVVKSGPGMVHAGDTATYTFKVTNVGDVALVNIAVTDSEFGAIGTIAGPLAVGASQTISKDFAVPGKKPGINCDNGHYNIATATGTDQLVPPKTVTDTDDHCTTIINPSIQVEKNGPGQVHSGDNVTYTFKVTNTGDVDLTNVKVTDNKFGDVGTIASLATGASTTISKNFVVPGVSSGPDCDEGHHNVATAVGTDPLDDTVSDTDGHCAQIINPAIEVVKSGPALAHEGDVVTYTFKVTNIGDVALTDVVVVDDIMGEIGTIAGTFDVGDTETLSKEYIVPGNRQRVDNVATACGDDPTNLEVCDDDPHSMIVIHPSISIDKTADPEVGGPRDVTYTYVVTNTGDVTLTDIVVDDDILGEIGTIDELEPGESDTLTRTVAVDGSSPTVNIGTACGDDPLGLETCADDDAEIAVVLGVTLPRTGLGLKIWLFIAGLALTLGAVALNLELATTTNGRSRARRSRSF